MILGLIHKGAVVQQIQQRESIGLELCALVRASKILGVVTSA
jgi:hypothetical protein